MNLPKPLLLIAAITALVLIVFSITGSNPHHLILLDTAYSAKALNLYQAVTNYFKLPVRVDEVNSGNDEIELTQTNIILRLKRGAGEDVVAHELMHAILKSEGYPDIFCLGESERARNIHKIIVGFLDHLIINERCESLGYNPRNGFLLTSDSFEYLLSLSNPPDANGRATLNILLLNELIKFTFYNFKVDAEPRLLQKWPILVPYWTGLKGRIESSLKSRTKEDMWNVAAEFNKVADQICKNNNASFRFSDIIGFGPFPLTNEDAIKPANEIFEISLEKQENRQFLIRKFCKRLHTMVDVCLIQLDTNFDDEVLVPSNISALDFANLAFSTNCFYRIP